MRTSGAQAAGEVTTRERPGAAGWLAAVIDDDDDLRDALVGVLTDSGYRVAEFGDAKAALRAMDHGVRPDIILLDLMMPGMNGWRFRLEQLSRPALAEVPVVALSADNSEFAAAINADAYLSKPVDGVRLCLVMGQVLLASERRRLAAQTAELERIRSLGMLVAGVAHEINNPLTYAIGSLELALRRCAELHASAGAAGPLDALSKDLDAAVDGTKRIAHIVRLLSTFAHGESEQAASTDVVRVIDAACRLAMHQIRGRAHLLCNLHPLPLVRASEGQLAQVMLNLLTNAAHAIPEGAPERHEIEIRTYTENGRAVIEVTDDGCGVPPEFRTRIFEPFFTTKPIGMGLGLGLSISRDIVTRAGGSISMRSDVGEGTTFRIELPIPAATLPVTERPPPRAKAAVKTAKPATRVLVIDDEALIGRVVGQALPECEVETTNDARDGLERAINGSFDVVLCDLQMPDLDGMQIYEELRRRRLDGKPAFVLMTGGVVDFELEDSFASMETPMLRKPFNAQELVRSLDLAAERSKRSHH
jgi:signal transduction histidine kinase